VGRGLRGKDDGGNVNNVQHKSNQNCHYESPHILTKIYLKIHYYWRVALLLVEGRWEIQKIQLSQVIGGKGMQS
jgi:hypothetical protein